MRLELCEDRSVFFSSNAAAGILCQCHCFFHFIQSLWNKSSRSELITQILRILISIFEFLIKPEEAYPAKLSLVFSCLLLIANAVGHDWCLYWIQSELISWIHPAAVQPPSAVCRYAKRYATVISELTLPGGSYSHVFLSFFSYSLTPTFNSPPKTNLSFLKNLLKFLQIKANKQANKNWWP